MICGEVAQSDGLIDSDAEHLAELNRLAGLLDPVHGRRWLRVALDAAAEISRTGHPRTVLELAILRMADGAGAQALGQLLHQLQGGAALRSGSIGAPRAQRPKPTHDSRQALGLRPAPPRRSEPAQRPAPQASPPAPRGRSEAPADGAACRSVSPPPEVVPTAPFLHAWRARSQPLAATLALAGLRIDRQRLVGRLDDARLAICRQERSRSDVAAALAEHGFVGARDRQPEHQCELRQRTTGALGAASRRCAGSGCHPRSEPASRCARAGQIAGCAG